MGARVAALPADLPWSDVDVVLECTGIFTKRDKAELHLKAGAKKVIAVDNSDILLQAQRIVDLNGFGDVVTCVRANKFKFSLNV